jgi:hypothetical protein
VGISRNIPFILSCQLPSSRKEHSLSFGASDASRSTNILHGVGEYSIYMVLVAPACGGYTAARLLCDQYPVSVFSIGDKASGLLEGAAGTGLNIWDSNGCYSSSIAMDISKVHLAGLDPSHGGIALCGIFPFATLKSPRHFPRLVDSGWL